VKFKTVEADYGVPYAQTEYATSDTHPAQLALDGTVRCNLSSALHTLACLLGTKSVLSQHSLDSALDISHVRKYQIVGVLACYLDRRSRNEGRTGKPAKILSLRWGLAFWFFFFFFRRERITEWRRRRREKLQINTRLIGTGVGLAAINRITSEHYSKMRTSSKFYFSSIWVTSRFNGQDSLPWAIMKGYETRLRGMNYGSMYSGILLSSDESYVIYKASRAK